MWSRKKFPWRKKMGFSLSGGLSSMGKAISTTAGDMIVSEQRAQLDRERLELAEKLAEGRETRRDDRQSIINSKAAQLDRDFRVDEAGKNRTHDLARDTKREEGDDRRARMTNERLAASEGAAAARFNKQMQFNIDQAEAAARDKKDQNFLNATIAANTNWREEKYTTADGEQATRLVKDVDEKIVAAALRATGRNEMAAAFAPPPSKAKAVPVTGKPKPPLGSFHTPGGADHGGD